jgi:Tfp pilus assembly protein PilW
MTTTTASSSTRPRIRSLHGITLVELMIAVALSSMILAAVMSSFIFLSRGTIATSDYADMDREARAALERFAREVRMSSGVTNFTTNTVTLSVQSDTPYTVNYTHVPADRAFYRAYGTAAEEVLIKGVESFAFQRFTLLQTPASNHLETKLLQLDLSATRTGPARAFASNNVISARYIMRNKIVAN